MPERHPRTRALAAPRWLASLALVCVAALFFWDVRAAGGGTLSVTATVTSSIRLVFVDAVGASETTVGYCPVTSSGTPNVGLDFSTCSRNAGCTRTCVLFTKLAAGGSNPYTAESAFDLVVSKANATTGSYNVQAWLAAAPPVEVTYYVNGMQLSTAAQVLTGQTTNPYGTRVSQDLMIRIRNNMAAGVVNQTIHYVATSN